MIDTRSNIAVYNGLQEVDCGLAVGGKRRSLGASPSDGIEAKKATARDLNCDATTKLKSAKTGISPAMCAEQHEALHHSYRACTFKKQCDFLKN
eukprot:6191536-Pleurochrysis_carterae.AAC.3